MSRIAIPGGRDVRATLDAPGEGGADSAGFGGATRTADASKTREVESNSNHDAAACVVACPPHPEHGGRRSDRRLRSISEALVGRGVACLRFDYGPWDQGRGERRDAGTALSWAGERYDRLGLVGYSFGGAVALGVATDRTDLDAVAALAPAATLPDGSDAADALRRIDAPTLVVHGERDELVDWQPVVDAAQELGHRVESVAADHHFVGQDDTVAAAVAPFLATRL